MLGNGDDKHDCKQDAGIPMATAPLPPQQVFVQVQQQQPPMRPRPAAYVHVGIGGGRRRGYYNRNDDFFYSNPYPYGGAPEETIMVDGVPMTTYWDSTPKRLTCQFCKADVVTVVKRERGLQANATAAGLCLMCCIPCALGVYCSDALKISVHTCPQCFAVLGKSVLTT